MEVVMKPETEVVIGAKVDQFSTVALDGRRAEHFAFRDQAAQSERLMVGEIACEMGPEVGI